MRQAALAVVLVGVLGAPAALAGNGQPQLRHTKADMARARAAAVHASDLSAGWKAIRAQPGNQPGPRCASYHPDQSDLVETGKYESPHFTLPDGSFVSSTTAVFRTVRMARAGYARVSVPALPGCFGELLGKTVGRPSAVKVVSTGHLDFPRLGDRSSAYRLAATYKVKAATLVITVDFVLVNRGRCDVAIIFFGIGKPFPAGLERGLAALTAARASS